jgi:hypothetical protein
MRRLPIAVALLAAACHRGGGAEKPTPPPPPDAAPPDAEEAAVTVPDAAPPAPPASITFAPTPWSAGTKVRAWRRTALVDDRGHASGESRDEIAFTVVASDEGGVIVQVGDDCTAEIARGTAKVTGDCQGGAADVAYKLDLVAQLLAAPRGTMRAGDRCEGLPRPLVALFRLQDAGAIVSARLADATDAAATYALHAELDGTLLKRGLHVAATLDGELQVDVHQTTMSGALRSARARISGWPVDDYHSTGALELSFGIDAQVRPPVRLKAVPRW